MIIIQVEEVISENQKIAAFIDVKTGGIGVARLDELTILDEPDESFFS